MDTSASNQVFYNLATVEDKNTLTFQLKDTDVAYANTLRRMILTGVECLAFNSKMNDEGVKTDVEIKTNTTPMTNEMLADRIGLIPIFVNMETWNPEGWDKKQFEFRLEMENTTNDLKPVKAGDIKVYKLGGADEGYVLYPPGNKEFFQPDPITGDTCLLAVLKAQQPNQAPQKIEFVARASVGTGTQHIRWSPVSQCSYNYTIDTDEGRQQQFFQRWLENSKKMSLDSLNDESGKKEMMIREFQTMEVQRCFKVNEKGDPNSFDFVIESIGTMPIMNIVERALYNIERKCTQYAGELPNDVKVVPADARMKGFDFYFPNEDHTLGNLFQAYMEANLMETGEISYVGYKVPHPLRAEMVLRIGVDFANDKARDGKQTVARAAISKAAAGCALMFRQWREDWVAAQTRPIGTRNRESLRLNVTNAKALETAAARVAPPPAATKPGAKGKRTPQASAFYGKYVEKATSKSQTPPYGATSAMTPVYGATSSQTPTYGALTPTYGPGGQTPPYGSATTAIPEGWVRKIDNEGRPYYSALNGALVQYEPPTASPYAPTSPPYRPSSPIYSATTANQNEQLPAGWTKKVRSENGAVYYETPKGYQTFAKPTQPASLIDNNNNNAPPPAPF